MNYHPLLPLLLATAVSAADCDTYRGVDGSGTYAETGLLRSWPEGGPKRLWSARTAHGWAGPAVVGDKVYIAGGKNCHLKVYDLDSGAPLANIFAGSAGWKRWDGPRSVPAVVDGRWSMVGMPNATLVGIDLQERRATWNVNAWKDFGSGKGYQGWGVAETPARHGNLLIFNACSRDQETPPLVAVDIVTGKTAWTMVQPPGTPEEPWLRYSAIDVSGVVIHHRGRAIVLYPTFNYLVALDATTGALLWRIRGGGSTLPPIHVSERGWVLANLTTPDKKGLALTCLELSPDGSTYTVRWRRPKACGAWAFAAVAGNRVFSHGNPVAPVLDADGKEVIAASVAEAAIKDAASIKGQTGCGSGGSALLCLDLDTGKLLDCLPANLGAGGHVVSAEGLIYAQDHGVAVVSETECDPPPEKKEQPAPATTPATTQLNVPPLRLRLIRPTAEGMSVAGTLTVPIRNSDELGGSTAGDVAWYAAIAPVIAHGRLFVRYGGLNVFDLRAEPPSLGELGDDGRRSFIAARVPLPASRIHNLRWSVPDPGGSLVGRGSSLVQLDAAGGLVCRQATDGTERWKQASSGKADSDPALLLREDAAYALAAGSLRRIALADGRQAWTVPATGTGLLACQDLILVAGKELNAHAVADGKPVWKAPIAGLPVKLRVEGIPLLAALDGRLLRTDGRILEAKLPAATVQVGEGTWRYAADGKGVLTASQLGGDGDNVTVTEAWSLPGTEPVSYLLVHQGRLLVVRGKILLTLEAATGKALGSLTMAAAPTASPLIASGHLWLPGAGDADTLWVCTLADTPAKVWTCTTAGGSRLPTFIEGGCLLRAGGQVQALLGNSPVQPKPLEITTVPDAPRPADLGTFADQTLSTTWLWAGPIPGKEPDRDHLEGLGGRQKAEISTGTTFTVDGKEFAFGPLPEGGFVAEAAYAGKKPVLELTVIHNKTWKTTGYFATTLDNDRERHVRFAWLPEGLQPWTARLDLRAFLNGVAIDTERPIKLGVGRHRLLVVAGVGECDAWGKLFTNPRLIDVSAEVSARLERDRREQADWQRYQTEEVGRPMRLP